MKYLFRSLLMVFSISQICIAGVHLVWEKDVSSYLHNPIDSILDIRCYANNRIGLLLGDPSFSGGRTTKKLLILDSDGSILYEDSVTDGALPYLGGSQGGSYILWSLGSSTRVYEPTLDDSYTYTNVSAKFHRVYGGAPSNYSNDPSVLVGYDGNVVKKYKLDGIPSNVEGTPSSGFSGDNYVLNWNSELNRKYQIQSSLTLTNWTDVGGILVGTGAPMTWANAITNSVGFYRVIKE